MTSTQMDQFVRLIIHRFIFVELKSFSIPPKRNSLASSETINLLPFGDFTGGWPAFSLPANKAVSSL